MTNNKESPFQQPDEETRENAKPIKQRLKESLEEIDTPEKAEAVVEQIVRDTQDKRAVEAAQEAPQAEGEPPATQAAVAAEAVEEAAKAQPTDAQRTAAVLETTAAEAAALKGPAYQAVAEAVQDVTNPVGEKPPEDAEPALKDAEPVLKDAEPVLKDAEPVKQAQRLLHEAMVRHPRAGLLQAYDTDLFILINNNLPRTTLTDTLFHQLSLWFTGGWAWLMSVAVLWPFRPEWSGRTIQQIILPILIPTLLVEGPIKTYFRRRRPYIDIVRAIVVGKKPGNWSFPSGHSASAFAGARMFSRVLPAWRPLWYTLAGLVAFSRIYLGAHYPGDVVSGSAFGFIFAELTRWLVDRLGLVRN
jgi:undecaprenyl-diphosphatase